MSLGRGQASESEIRNALISTLHDQSSAHIAEEFWVPRLNVRADVVTIGEQLCAFEIKSHRDSLRRLPAQADAYATLFHKCTLVVAEKHYDRACEMLPPWWGIVRVSDTGDLLEERNPRTNPGVDAEVIVRLIWREEARRALDRLGANLDDSMGRASMWRELLKRLSLVELQELVTHILYTRHGLVDALT